MSFEEADQAVNGHGGRGEGRPAQQPWRSLWRKKHQDLEFPVRTEVVRLGREPASDLDQMKLGAHLGRRGSSGGEATGRGWGDSD
jgi:hypothetical protein